MGERGRVNTAIGIMGFVGGLVIYSAIDKSFTVPAELWGMATAATVYLFSTAGRNKNRGGSEVEDES